MIQDLGLTRDRDDPRIVQDRVGAHVEPAGPIVRLPLLRTNNFGGEWP